MLTLFPCYCELLSEIVKWKQEDSGPWWPSEHHRHPHVLMLGLGFPGERKIFQFGFVGLFLREKTLTTGVCFLVPGLWKKTI